MTFSRRWIFFGDGPNVDRPGFYVGNSSDPQLVVILPKAMAKASGLRQTSYVSWTISEEFAEMCFLVSQVNIFSPKPYRPIVDWLLTHLDLLPEKIQKAITTAVDYDQECLARKAAKNKEVT